MWNRFRFVFTTFCSLLGLILTLLSLKVDNRLNFEAAQSARVEVNSG